MAAIAATIAAAMATPVATMAPVASTVATAVAAMTGVAAIAAAAAMTTKGQSLAFTAHEGNTNQREKQRETKYNDAIHPQILQITYRYR
jgi:hypothetical protein